MPSPNPYNLPTPTTVNPYNTPSLSDTSIPLSEAPVPFDASPLGIATNTVTGLGPAAQKVGSGILNVGKGIASNLFPGIPEIAHGITTGDWNPYMQGYQQSALGKAGAAEKEGSQSPDFARNISSFAGGFAAPDLEGVSSLANFFAKEVNPGAISEALQKMGIHPELIEPFTKLFVSTKTPEDAQAALTALHTAQTVGTSAKASAPVEPVTPAAETPVPPVTDHTYNFAPETKPTEPPITPQSVQQSEPTAEDIFGSPNPDHPEGQPQEEQPVPSVEERVTAAQTQDIPTSVESLQELNQTRDKLDTPSDASVVPSGKYVKDDDLNISPEGNDKKTVAGIRQAYTEVKNSQILRGNHLADELKAAAPKEQSGMFWAKAAKGDTAVLQGLLEDPRFAPYHEGIQQALDLSPKAKAALATGEQYYKEAGQVALKNGTINDLRENYQNRIYKPELAGDYVKNEGGQSLKQTTMHAKSRIFNSEIDAVKAGKQFATTNYADALAIHNEEMARVNTARKTLATMEHGGLGAWTDRVPSGWSQVGQLRKGTQVFAAPTGIAKGLRAITDPDFMSKIDTIRGIQKYQGLVKSVDLAMSFYHHLTFVTQTLSSRGGGLTTAQMIAGGLKMNTPAFRQMELDFVQHGGLTAHVAKTQDIMAHLTEGNDIVSKALRLPVLKQATNAIEASNEFLFGKMQRFLKTMTFQKESASWVASHPNATNAEVLAAKRGYAKAINANYGGLNWQAMGITKSNQSLLRTLFLAPDWLTSAGAQVKYALSDTGTAGNTARATIIKAIVGGMAVTEGLNKLITGHFTDQNPKGHTLELEIAPNVYVSLIRGAPGELVKLLSNVTESGPIQGVSRYGESKLAAIPRTALGLVSGVDYTGRNIYTAGQKHPNAISKTFGGLLFAIENGSPFPFGLGNTGSYLGSGSATPAGVAGVATGVGRYSVPNKKAAAAAAKAKAINPYNE